MRILEFSAYAYYKGKAGFEKNNSGFAYMVSDICEALASCGDKVYLLTQSGITEGFKNNAVTVLRKRWRDLIFNFHLVDIVYGIQALNGSTGPIIEKLKILFYYLNRGYAEKIIRIVKPDIIQIQSITNYTVPFMMAASSQSVPFIVSNHGLATFLVEMDPKSKRMEKNFFKLAERNNTLVTAVSSGIKHRLEEYYSLKGDNIIVVSNGVEFKDLDDSDSELLYLKEQLNITDTCFVFICVGSISSRKNQLQVVRAFKKLLDKKIDLKLIFVGYGPLFTELQEYININKLNDYVILLGGIEHNMMPYFYKLSNCTILASVDEGFGLSVIEGYSFGLPAVIYGDLDAVEDISFSDATVIVTQRGDVQLSEGMAQAVRSDWDKEVIKKHALKFSKMEMGRKYQDVLKKGIEEKSTIPFCELKVLFRGSEKNV